MRPLVSVCMITYNHEKFIAEAIEGVLMQEMDFDVELIIADDASTDRTGEIIQSYIEKHPRSSWIKYTRHPVNKGMMGNFVWALKQCKGEYIALCEGDDYWIDLYKLQKQVDFLENNIYFSFTFHDCIKVDEFGQILAKSYLPSSSKKILSYSELAQNYLIPTCSVVLRKNCLPDPFPEEFFFTSNGDTFIFFMLSFKGAGYFYDSIQSSCYRVQGGGVWSGLSKTEMNFRILNTYYLLRRIEKPKFYDFYVEKKISSHSYELAKLIKKTNRSLAFYYFQQSILSSLKSGQVKIAFYSFIKIFF